MKTNSRITGLATVFFAFTLIMSHAGPLVSEHISGDAKWLIHFDMDSLKNSQLGGFLKSETATPEMEKKLDNIEAMFGFDPWRDLSTIVIYGTDASNEEGSTLIYGVFDQARLMNVLRENDGFQEMEYAGHKIYRGTRPARIRGGKAAGNASNRQGWCAFHSRNLIVLGKTADSVKTALDVLDGRRASLGRQGAFLTTESADPGSFLLVKADLAGLNIAPHAILLRATDALEMTVAEQNGSLTARLLMEAEDAVKAGHIRAIAEGMLAGAALSGERNPVIGLLADSTTISVSGAIVEMNLFCPVDSIKAAVLQKIRERLQKGL